MRNLILILTVLFTVQLFATIINIPTEQETIQEGINVAVNGDTVLVQPGIYYENLVIDSLYISLFSNYVVSQDTLDIYNTVINGNQTGSVIKLVDCGSLANEIIGFSISDGFDSFENGGGIHCENSAIYLENLRLYNNSAGYQGGGIAFMSSNAELQDVKVFDNDCGIEGGGLWISYSTVIINESEISSNYADTWGSGVSSSYSELVINDCLISNNTAGSFGGGLRLQTSELNISNSSIIGNIAGGWGGGMYIKPDSNVNFDNVDIKYNEANINGAGIYVKESELNFDEQNKSTIYSNSVSSRGFGADIYSLNCEFTDVYVDTFTIFSPSDYYVSPSTNFNIDMQSSIIDSLINSDLYVSVNGDDSNSGLVPEEPLKTISFALSRIYSDPDNIRTIFLDEGVYGPDTTGERMPIAINSYIIIDGASPATTFLEGNGESNILTMNSVYNSKIRNVCILNGSEYAGGAISMNYSDPIFENVLFYNNTADNFGGVMHCYQSSPVLRNITSVNNTAGSNGGSFYINETELTIINSILWSNTPNEICVNEYESASIINIAFTDIMGGANSIITNNNTTLNWLTGNITDNPIFFDQAINDFSLADNSPCIDAGIDFFEYNNEVFIDIDEDDYFGMSPDMGCYESGLISNAPNEAVEQIKASLNNYPNPFNPNTKIVFTIPKPAQVKLEIFNIKGQKVKTLINENM
ncbi:MAG: hypothetical protein U9N34_03220, partial [Candidatus Cloacimonadota bacterium]|nr:hypothetical protein [Candidatus Cloacimonadota bacterium]